MGDFEVLSCRLMLSANYRVGARYRYQITYIEAISQRTMNLFEDFVGLLLSNLPESLVSKHRNLKEPIINFVLSKSSVIVQSISLDEILALNESMDVIEELKENICQDIIIYMQKV